MSLVYRFRIIFEDYDDVQRDIDIRSTQTFEDLHHTIQQAIGFDDKKQASFFVSNDFWKKGQEISLEKRKDKNDQPLPLMKKSRLCDFISDPHQKFLYISDYDAGWNFTMELIKLIPNPDPIKSYPSCIKSVGEAPKQYNIVTPKPSAILADEEEEIDDIIAPEAIHTAEEGVEDDELIGMNSEGEDEELELEEEASGDDEPLEEDDK
jgi:hypothetical protein